MRTRPIAPRTLAALLAAALATACESQWLVRTPELDLELRLDEMRRRNLLPEETDPVLPEETVLFFDRLAEIDAWLDIAGSWEEPLPDWLDPANTRAVRERLETLEPFFEQMTALLEEPFVHDYRETRDTFARRTSVRETDVEEFDRYATPPIERLSRWVDLLCADAMIRVAETLRSERTVRSLAQSFDLIRLLDDGSLLGSYVCAEMETITLLTLRRVGPGPRVDPELLRSVIDPRLAVLGDERRVWDCIRNEIAHRVEIAEVLLREPDHPHEDHWLEFLDVSRARLVKRTLDLIYMQDELRQASVLCARLSAFGEGHPLQPLLDAVQGIHTLDVYTQVSRLAIAINAHRFVRGDWPQYYSDTERTYTDGMPLPPCRGERIVYDRGFNWVQLRSQSRLGRKRTEEDALLVWFWGEASLEEFEKRDNPGAEESP